MDTNLTAVAHAAEASLTESHRRLGLFVDAKKQRRFQDWFIPRHASDGRALETIFQEWLSDDRKYMLRILGETGAGKTTLKDYLFLQLAERVLRSDSDRIPVEMNFAEAVNAVTSAGGQSDAIDLGPRNEVIFLDGHEGRLAALEDRATVVRGTKVVVLQRDAIIRSTPSVTRLASISSTVDGCTTTWLRSLTPEEARKAVELFFPIALEERGATSEPLVWQEERLSVLRSGAFDGLLVSPAMAHQLCRMAADPGIEMRSNQDHGRWAFRAASVPSRF
ncbi:hypothetical protein [Rhizobium sp. BK376]|uniref:hypothetical protein n=1 Tax=Rhizobium sp. BK376 TaxID=2512149 RepID=UPI001049DB2E|nr:hypothetical protein [Rhizobium sp. BK376]TCR79604.1 hypothetical protein EV561_115102 [Rhizobium sp. BK376]